MRADKDGRLFVLEVNPKPDLKMPDGARDQPRMRGARRATRMSYDDLILSMFANRMAGLLDGSEPIRGDIVRLIED